MSEAEIIKLLSDAPMLAIVGYLGHQLLAAIRSELGGLREDLKALGSRMEADRNELIRVFLSRRDDEVVHRSSPGERVHRDAR